MQISPRMKFSRHIQFAVFREKKLRKKISCSGNQQKLVNETVDFSVDMMGKKFSRHDFKLRTFKSRVKNIYFTISKSRGYFSLK